MIPKTKPGFLLLQLLLLVEAATALKIDNQLAVIKNDCYERLAIGQRHDAKDVYKTSHATTVLECQLFCTKEKEECKSFSFGIGAKGNATCELSNDPVRETADLKPIGTHSDADFDLYIKKLGCTLVIDKNSPWIDHDKRPGKPTNGGYNPKPEPETGGYDTPKPEISYGFATTRPGYAQVKPQTQLQHVQTLVSISSGPRKPVLHPVHDILISGDTKSYARPPFRPSALNHPYHKPGPDPDRYDSRPLGSSLVPERYGSYIPRPENYYNRPMDGYDYHKPAMDYNYYKPTIDYNQRPRPANNYGGYNSYSDYYYKPSDYNDGHRPNPSDGPHFSNDYNDYYRPSHAPGRPDYNSHRPNPFNDYDQRPKPTLSDYNGSDRPKPEYNQRPNDGYSRPYPADYSRPNFSDYNKPNPPNDHNRPSSSVYNKPNPSDYDRPNLNDYNKPNPSDYNKPNPSDYNKPNPSDYNRPGSSDYNQPNPSTDYNKPNPSDYNKPNPSDYNKPHPSTDYNKPNPSDYNKPNPSDYNKPNPSDYNKPSSSDYNKPNPSNDYNRPSVDYNRPNPSSGYNQQPNPVPSDYNGPNPPQLNYNTPSDYNKPGSSGYNSDYNRPSSSDYNRPNPASGYFGTRPSRPTTDYLFSETDRYDQNHEKPSKPTNSPYDNTIKGGGSKPKDPHPKPIVTQSTGPNGESITSIITEIDEACFRRVLAGKRVTRALVRRALFCERVEDCQRECADEKRFVCEGFNYRLDPSGRGKGECELLDIPLSHLDIGRDLYPDRDYDYYERDRNAATASCRRRYDGPPNRRYDQRPPIYDWHDDRNRYGNRRPRPDFYDYDAYRPSQGNRRGDFAYHHQSHHSEHSHNYHYDHLEPPYDYKTYEPYLPPGRRPYEDRRWGWYGGSYGTNYKPNEFDRKNFYLPPDSGYSTKDWGQYGGSYGNGGIDLQYNGYGHSQSFDFWGLNKYEEKFHNYLPHNQPVNGNGGGYLPSSGGSYLPRPPYKPPSSSGGSYSPQLPGNSGGSYLPEVPGGNSGGSYLPQPPYKPPVSGGTNYLPETGLQPPFGSGGSYIPERPSDYNAILPAEPRYPFQYDFLKDECSLRSAAGFRLAKGIVKKYNSVPNLYECEILCFKEREFPCASYAFKYSLSLDAPKDNCYLSNRSYKELDFYTDLEPDKDFDVYTMNNMKKCEQPAAFPSRDDSECFWRVRSAQRLVHKIVRDSLVTKSIVECQIECLKSRRFTCRAFSYRYGSPVIGGSVDNCLLTDWPYFELDQRIHFVAEPGFEVYERGSFGHGCEPNHFGIRGRPTKPGTRIDQLCYVGYGSPVKLLPQATRKEIRVTSEEECKAECSKLRETTLFQCMSVSFTTNERWGPNCKLSDILQRDLLPTVDYIPETHSWLFSWDHYNPECRAIASEPVPNHIGHKEKENRNIYDEVFNAIGTWRVYSVSGWPCRRGSVCRENREAGFWFCELEGGDANAWDYCCRPDHQCGFSDGFPYQWCYVGPTRTQWRKCSDRYYPYVHNYIDRLDQPPSTWTPPANNYLPEYRPPPIHRPGFRPDRPPAPPTHPPPRPSLDEYEMQFEHQFLDPPKPGGFGQPRHWPMSYLHKEMPPNNTDTESRLANDGKTNPKFAAIQNLIDIIKSNDLKNVQYQITNESNKQDDILFVKIPLPTNFTHERRKNEKMVTTSEQVVSQPIDVPDLATNSTKRVQKSVSLHDSFAPPFRRGFVTRTNVTRSRTSRRL